jgi:1-acyl-sn-glycerol-3-phosphate acyltransferase
MCTLSTHADTPQLYPARLLARVLFTIFFSRCAVHGRENIPRGGPAYILALNCESLVDPPLVLAFYPDLVYFVADSELVELPLLGWGLKRSGTIAVRRGALDPEAIGIPLRYLTELNRNLAMFVAGTRPGDGELSALRGCAFLAIESKAPVVPAFIEGTVEVLPRAGFVPRFSSRLALHIGRPITIHGGGAEQVTLESATETVRSAIEALNPGRTDPLCSVGSSNRGGTG